LEILYQIDGKHVYIVEEVKRIAALGAFSSKVKGSGKGEQKGKEGGKNE
jgi:hypothetical protein